METMVTIQTICDTCARSGICRYTDLARKTEIIDMQKAIFPAFNKELTGTPLYAKLSCHEYEKTDNVITSYAGDLGVIVKRIPGEWEDD